MFCTLISLLENNTFPKGILEHAAIPTILQNKLTYVVYTPIFMPGGKAMTYFFAILSNQYTQVLVQLHSISVQRLRPSKPTLIWTQPLWLNF